MSFQIIPAIDLIGGQCVRLRQGDYGQKTVYDADPVAVAKRFEDAGIQRLHLVDLDGAEKGSPQNLAVLENICRETGLQVDFGGGIKTAAQVQATLDAGAQLVTIGSLAVTQPPVMKQWLNDFGAHQFWLGADVRNYELMIHGWKTATGVNLLDFVRDYQEVGVLQFFCTDIEKDGMMQGPSTDLYVDLLAKVPGIQLYASGGVTTLEDLEALAAAGLSGAIVGKALYEGRIALADLKRFA